MAPEEWHLRLSSVFHMYAWMFKYTHIHVPTYIWKCVCTWTQHTLLKQQQKFTKLVNNISPNNQTKNSSNWFVSSSWVVLSFSFYVFVYQRLIRCVLSKRPVCKLSLSSVGWAEAVWFDIIPFIYMCFYCPCFWEHSKVSLPRLMSRSFPHMLSSSSFSFTGLTFMSLTIFIHDVGEFHCIACGYPIL